MRGLVYWPLFGLLLPQAIWLRRTAPRFAPAAGATHGLISHPSHPPATPIRLLALGDSIIAGVGAGQLQQALVGQTAQALSDRMQQSVDWVACGRSGYAAAAIRNKLLPKAPSQPFDVVLVSTGVNDVLSGCSGRQWKAELHALHAAIQQHSPQALTVFCGVPPMGQFPRVPQPLRALFGARAAYFNRLLAQQVSQWPTAEQVNIKRSLSADLFADDGFHPSEAGYARYGARVAEAMAGRLKNDRAQAVVSAASAAKH